MTETITDKKSTVKNYQLHEGDTVEIKEGQFKGRSGIVQQVNKNYIRIIIESIGFVLVVRSKNDVDVT